MTKTLTDKIDAAYASGDHNELFCAVNRLALGITKHDDDAAQDATIKVWQNMGKFAPRARFSTWVVTVLKNAFLDRVRAKAVHMEEIDKDWNEIPRESGTHFDKLVLAAARSRGTSVTWPVWFPNERAEIAFTMKMGGKSRNEIAEQLGMSVRALDKAMERWRKQIAESRKIN